MAIYTLYVVAATLFITIGCIFGFIVWFLFREELREWWEKLLERLDNASDRAFYWALDMVLGKHEVVDKHETIDKEENDEKECL